MSARAPFWLVFVSLVTLPACVGSVHRPGASVHAHAPDPTAVAEAPQLELEAFEPSDRQRITAVQAIVESAARAQDLDPELVNAVIWVESRFRPEAKSSAGARGLMQLMPSTAAYLARELGVQRPRAHDPKFNVHAGAYYLRRLLDRFEGDEVLAIAAYNAGPGNVKKWKASGDPLPATSESYVAAVMDARARFSMHGPGVAADAPLVATAQPSPEPHDDVTHVTSIIEAPVSDSPVDYEPIMFEPNPALDMRPDVPEPTKHSEPVIVEPQSPRVGAGILPDV